MRTRDQNRPSGFTLLEVLVAIVVFSFGVLAIISLQAAAIKSTTARSTPVSPNTHTVIAPSSSPPPMRMPTR